MLVDLLQLPWDDVSEVRRRERVLLEQGGKCALCGIMPEWSGKPLRFQLDHISGNRLDESRENLRMLCPNCHSQTPTWGVRNASDEGKQRMTEAKRKRKKG